MQQNVTSTFMPRNKRQTRPTVESQRRVAYTPNHGAILSAPWAVALFEFGVSVTKQTNNIFYTTAIVTAGTRDDMAIDLVQEIGRRTTVITQDTKETVFLFQRLSIVLERGNAVSIFNTMNIE